MTEESDSKADNEIFSDDIPKSLVKEWNWKTFLSVPANSIRNYFGEKIAMYFSFLSLYTIYLIPISLLGIPIFFLQLFLNRSVALSVTNGIFGCSMVLWMAILYEGWKRKEIYNAIVWG